jgi:hypothetical protein
MSAADGSTSSRPWLEPQAVDLWKVHAERGGADKDRMVTVCTWLLGLAVAIVVLAFGQGVETTLGTEKVALTILALFGLGLSILSAFAALIYGGYANRNWATADEIARLYEWDLLDPEHEPRKPREERRSDRRLDRVLGGWARNLSKPREPYSQLAPIFKLYLGLSVASAGAQVIVLIMIPTLN